MRYTMRLPLVDTKINKYIYNNYHYGYLYLFQIAFNAIYGYIGYSQDDNKINHIKKRD